MSTLQEDLLREFREQKELIYKQLAIFDPLGTQLRRPAATRLVHKGALIVAEVFCYVMCVGCIVLAIFLHKIHPFYILSELRVKDEFRQLGTANIHFLNICIYALIAMLAIALYTTARCMRIIRLKNSILNFAGRHIHTLVGQHLTRKAVIETIEQRHRQELPVMPHTRMDDYEGVRINEVPNPGYGE